MKKRKQQQNVRHIVIARPRIRAWWPADAPMNITDQTVVTVAPTPERALRTNTHSKAG